MSLGIYIHIPFCRSKCGYCDFSSFAGIEDLMEPYLKALSTEIGRFEQHEDDDIDSIFIGGGTPSLLSSQQLKELLQTINKQFQILPDAELSMEVNPSSATKAYMEQMIETGINRISVGVQSFNPKNVGRLGRQARESNPVRTIENAQQVGFNNISLDLMFGVPEQTLSDLEEDLQIAVSLSPSHISAYELTLAEGTKLFDNVQNRMEQIPDEDTVCDMYEKVSAFLPLNRYRQYEVSNYAKTGMECRHNLSSWRGGQFIGFGAAAHMFYRGKRLYTPNNIKKFIENSKNELSVFKEFEETENQRLLNYLLMRFRIIDEIIDFSAINQLFSIDFLKLYDKETKKLKSDGLIKLSNLGMSLTSKGRFLLNNVLLEFVKVR